MSRSRKKNSFVKYTSACTDKEHKKQAHKTFRQAERQAIHHGDDPPEDIREVYNGAWLDRFDKTYLPEECWYYPPLNESQEEQQKEHDEWREKVMRK